MNKLRFTVLAAMILAAAASRLLPHPPNFTPIAAIALFGGAQSPTKLWAFFVPLGGLVLSDLVFGFYAITPVVYASFALIVWLGMWVRGGSPERILFASATCVSFPSCLPRLKWPMPLASATWWLASRTNAIFRPAPGLNR